MTRLTNCDYSKVRSIVLDADGIALSGLLAQPQSLRPRAVVVAVHGGGMRAGYFHGQAHPSLSLLTLGAQLGYTVLAIDRPGYGTSSAQLPRGQHLAGQATTLHAALADFAAHYELGAGFFLVAHSYGGKLALHTAAGERLSHLLGLDISGCAQHYATDVQPSLKAPGRELWRLHWGAARLYPPGTFVHVRSLLAPVPELEAQEAQRWPEDFSAIAEQVRVPVRFTFAEHELWWQHDAQAVAAMTALLSASRVVVDRQSNAGHNISLGWAARSYHLRALAFAEECAWQRDACAAGGQRGEQQPRNVSRRQPGTEVSGPAAGVWPG